MTGEQSTVTHYQAMIDALTPALYRRLQGAVETGRWPDGRPVTPTQREHALQAVIAWEVRNLPADQRTGYLESPACPSHAEPDIVQPVTLMDGVPGNTA